MLPSPSNRVHFNPSQLLRLRHRYPRFSVDFNSCILCSVHRLKCKVFPPCAVLWRFWPFSRRSTCFRGISAQLQHLRVTPQMSAIFVFYSYLNSSWFLFIPKLPSTKLLNVHKCFYGNVANIWKTGQTGSWGFISRCKAAIHQCLSLHLYAHALNLVPHYKAASITY